MFSAMGPCVHVICIQLYTLSVVFEGRHMFTYVLTRGEFDALFAEGTDQITNLTLNDVHHIWIDSSQQIVFSNIFVNFHVNFRRILGSHQNFGNVVKISGISTKFRGRIPEISTKSNE